ncbi:MAG: Fur family transcriptional regulator [Pseudomonadota bacterium]
MAQPASKPVALSEEWHEKAVTRCAERGARLTPSRLAAYTELVNSDQPLTAYELVARLEDRKGKKVAPLTVYRHLDFLIGVGLVHRLESKQSYLPCSLGEHSHDSPYLLCSSCGKVDELDASRVTQLLSSLAEERAFTLASSVIELSGVCADCESAGPSA